MIIRLLLLSAWRSDSEFVARAASSPNFLGLSLLSMTFLFVFLVVDVGGWKVNRVLVCLSCVSLTACHFFLLFISLAARPRPVSARWLWPSRHLCLLSFAVDPPSSCRRHPSGCRRSACCHKWPSPSASALSAVRRRDVRCDRPSVGVLSGSILGCRRRCCLSSPPPSSTSLWYETTYAFAPLMRLHVSASRFHAYDPYTSMLQQQMYRRSLRSSARSAAQMCRSVPAHSFVMPHRACTSGIWFASGWKSEPRYGNCQQFLTSFSPHLTLDNLSFLKLVFFKFPFILLPVGARVACTSGAFSSTRRWHFRLRRLSLASLFHPHIQHRILDSPG